MQQLNTKKTLPPWIKFQKDIHKSLEDLKHNANIFENKVVEEY